MKKKFFALILWSFLTSASSVDLKITSKKSQSQPILLWCIKEKDGAMPQLVNHMKRALAFTRQCNVSVGYFDTIPSKEELKKLKKDRGFNLVIALMPYGRGYEWRLYNTRTPTLHAVRRYEKRGPESRGWAYNICDEIWPLLMHSDGFF